eukprot:scaffold1966_cov118-Isochrysis_galbana.AAC.5
MNGRFLLLVLGFAPCPVLPFARAKARQLVSVIVLGVTLATKVPVGPSFLFPQSVLELRLVNQSINQSLMSISSYASDHSAASNPHSCEFIQSNPSRQSGMVQPVVNEMFATVPPVRLFSVYSLRVQPSIRHYYLDAEIFDLPSAQR